MFWRNHKESPQVDGFNKEFKQDHLFNPDLESSTEFLNRLEQHFSQPAQIALIRLFWLCEKVFIQGTEMVWNKYSVGDFFLPETLLAFFPPELNEVEIERVKSHLKLGQRISLVAHLDPELVNDFIRSMNEVEYHLSNALNKSINNDLRIHKERYLNSKEGKNFQARYMFKSLVNMLTGSNSNLEVHSSKLSKSFQTYYIENMIDQLKLNKVNLQSKQQPLAPVRLTSGLQQMFDIFNVPQSIVDEIKLAVKHELSR